MRYVRLSPAILLFMLILAFPQLAQAPQVTLSECVTASGGGTMRSNSPYLHRISEILNPARTLAYQENNGRYAWAAAPDPCDFLDGIPGNVRGWHGQDWSFNAAFVDGHADTVYMRGYRTELVFPRDWSLQNSYRCIIIRGDSWQIDTLPAPPVGTLLWWSGGGGRPSWEGCIGS